MPGLDLPLPLLRKHCQPAQQTPGQLKKIVWIKTISFYVSLTACLPNNFHLSFSLTHTSMIPRFSGDGLPSLVSVSLKMYRTIATSSFMITSYFFADVSV